MSKSTPTIGLALSAELLALLRQFQIHYLAWDRDLLTWIPMDMANAAESRTWTRVRWWWWWILMYCTSHACLRMLLSNNCKGWWDVIRYDKIWQSMEWHSTEPDSLLVKINETPKLSNPGFGSKCGKFYALQAALVPSLTVWSISLFIQAQNATQTYRNSCNPTLGFYLLHFLTKWHSANIFTNGCNRRLE